jgi:hypothetical protein
LLASATVGEHFHQSVTVFWKFWARQAVEISQWIYQRHVILTASDIFKNATHVICSDIIAKFHYGTAARKSTLAHWV